MTEEKKEIFRQELEATKQLLEEGISKKIHDMSWIRPMLISEKAAQDRLKEAVFRVERMLRDLND